MTDHPTPTPDPADPWRGRFPVPGGPMAPPPAPGPVPPPAPGMAPYPGPFGPGPPGGPAGRSRGPLVAAAVIIVMALVAAAGTVLVLVRAGDDGDGGDSAVDGMVIDLIATQRYVLVALEGERNLAVFELMGMADVVSPPVDDPEDARRSTDEAIAALDALVRSAPAATAYQPAMEQLGGLAELRSSVDGYSGPRTAKRDIPYTEAFGSVSRGRW